jgi:hypothetical protein
VSADGPRIRVLDGGSLVATVDARTFAVREPGAATNEPRHTITPPADDASFPWPALLLAGGLAGLCTCAVVIARRRARAPLGRGESIVR